MPHSVTTIENGVRELEVVLPANFSDEMDIHDTGAGTGKIMAEGDEELRPTALGATVAFEQVARASRQFASR